MDAPRGPGEVRQRRTRICRTHEEALEVEAQWFSERKGDRLLRGRLHSFETLLAQKYADEVGGAVGVTVSGGIVDVLVAGKQVVEFKRACWWKAALGQVLVYSRDTGLAPVIHLFDTKPMSNLAYVQETCRAFGVEVVFTQHDDAMLTAEVEAARVAPKVSARLPRRRGKRELI